MTWFKVDDALATHDKVLAAGNAAMGLWVRAGAWSAQHLTDGHVPPHAVRLLGTLAQAKALVRCGLWLEVDEGFRFHEWHDYQPTRAKVEADREEARNRMRRLRSGDVRPNSEGTSDEVRDPRPVPSHPDLSVVTSVSRSPLHQLDSDGLTRISKALNGCPEKHARECAAWVLAKAPKDVRNPTAYVLKAIRDDPDAFRYKRGNPKRGDECRTHAGQWADHCAGCAADRKAADR